MINRWSSYRGAKRNEIETGTRRRGRPSPKKKKRRRLSPQAALVAHPPPQRALQSQAQAFTTRKIRALASKRKRKKLKPEREHPKDELPSRRTRLPQPNQASQHRQQQHADPIWPFAKARYGAGRGAGRAGVIDDDSLERQARVAGAVGDRSLTSSDRVGNRLRYRTVL